MPNYASDLNDAQWSKPSPRLSNPNRSGPKSDVDLREVANGVFYQLRTGRQWRLLPKEYGSWRVIAGCWRRWSHSGAWERANTALREEARMSAEKKAQILRRDPGQPVGENRSKRGMRSYDAGKKVKGRKRHIPASPNILVKF